jgi:hypothetical protein
MPRRLRLVVLAVLVLTAWGAWPQGLKGETAMTQRKMTLEQRVGTEVFHRAGLDSLKPDQRQALADWLERYTREMVAATEEACRRQGPQGPAPWPTPGAPGGA